MKLPTRTLRALPGRAIADFGYYSSVARATKDDNAVLAAHLENAARSLRFAANEAQGMVEGRV